MMAGVLQTGAFVNGEWISESLDINTVLKRNETKQRPEIPKSAKLQDYGLLSLTVIESPIIRWILPVNIRGVEGGRDVAFISDNLVQIRHLDEKGQFQDIARKSDFGSRIRNARIVGAVQFGTESPDHRRFSPIESEDVSMEDAWTPTFEYIVLALENGNIVFLFARTVEKQVRLVATHHTVSRPMLSEQPGTHIALDPSLQYMALAGAENVFAVYALQPANSLGIFDASGPVSPVESERYIHVEGVIYKMEFLYPSADDPNHIILLLLVVSRGTTRMFVYDWVAGQSLRNMRSNFKRGTIVIRQHRMPLLLIPLRIQSAVLLVSDGTMAVCNGILEGIPKYTEMNIKFVKESPRYLGSNGSTPLWTSWFRPLRTYSYSKGHDDIYLAREDGAVLFIENSTEYFVQAQMDMYVDCNIDTAFACLDKAEDLKPGDQLVVGGDSCNGGLYLVEARYPPVLLSRLPNWSPTIDFVVTNKESRHGTSSTSHLGKTGLSQRAKPEQIFALTGRGIQYGNALSEMRLGHEAHLQVENELDVPIDDAWYLPSNWNKAHSKSSHMTSTLMLLSIGNQSILLGFAADDFSIEEIDQKRTWLDLTHRTIAAAVYEGVIIQVTERNVTISTKSAIADSPASYRKEYSAENPILAAYIYRNELVLMVHTDNEKEGVLYLSAIMITYRFQSTPAVSREIECRDTTLAINTFPSIVSVVKHENGDAFDVLWDPEFREQGEIKPGDGTLFQSLFNLFRVEVRRDGSVNIEGFRAKNSLKSSGLRLSDSCISLVALQTVHKKSTLVLAGHRDGLLVMVHCEPDSNGQFGVLKKQTLYTIGSTSVLVKVDRAALNVALVCCDGKVWRVCFDDQLYSDPVLNRIWFTDVDDPYMLQPNVNQICSSAQELLLVSGNKIVVAVLDPDLRPRAVPRPILLSGHPSRLLFDETLGVLVAVVKATSETSEEKVLSLLDPETGTEIPICWPNQVPTLVQENQARKSPASHFFSDDETVLCLCSIADSDDPASSVIIVGLKNKITGGGALVVYYLSRAPRFQKGQLFPGHDVICTGHEEVLSKQPIYAIAALSRTIIFCRGDEIRSYGLRTHDLHTQHTSRKILELPSPAVSISITASYWLNVHTSRHSLLTYQFSGHIANLWDELQFDWNPQFADEFDRDGLDHVVLEENRSKNSSRIIMVSDKACSVAGLSYSRSLEPLAQNQKTLFEAELTASILKFGHGNTRPPWDSTWREDSSGEDARPSQNGAEAVGITIDGSLRHFTILNEVIYKLLQLLQDRVHQLEASSTLPYQPVYWRSEPDPSTKHIDGDSLKKFLRRGYLDRLLQVDIEGSSEASDDEDSDEENMGKLEATRVFQQEYVIYVLRTLDESMRNELLASGGNGDSRGNEELLGRCKEETYKLLETLLRPVL